MENQQNDISSQAMLSAIVGMMFFAPLVENNVKNDTTFSTEEKEFILGYTQVGYANLILLIATLIVAIINAFWSHTILYGIITFGSFSIFAITIFSLFACINNINMRKSDEKIVTDVQHKGQLLKAYIPGLNFVSWYRQGNYNMPYWWLKESIFFWIVFIFGTLILKSYFGLGILIAIIIRVGLLMFNIDIIPLSIKKAINSMFYCNPGEMSAYLFAPIVAKFKKADYMTVLQARKQGYSLGQSFGLGILVQYIIFMAIVYFIYRNANLSGLDVIGLFGALLWLMRVIVFFVYKKNVLKIPILSEIVSILFH